MPGRITAWHVPEGCESRSWGDKAASAGRSFAQRRNFTYAGAPEFIPNPEKNFGRPQNPGLQNPAGGGAGRHRPG
jgi:hypothetical protein